MLSRSNVPAFKGAPSLHQALELSNVYLEGAFRSTDRDIALLLCHDANAALIQAKDADRDFPDHLKDASYQIWRSGIAAAYIDLAMLLEFLGYSDKAEPIRKKAEKWGGTVHDPGRLAQSSIPSFVTQSSNGIIDSTGNTPMQLASSTASSSRQSDSTGDSMQLHAIVAGKVLQELEVCDNVEKRALYREYCENGPTDHPLKTSLPHPAPPSPPDRIQNRPDIEGNLRMLRKQRTQERGIAVYVPLQAKNSTHGADDARFPLMECIKEFLDSERKVFLLLGESGAGKSTFSRELEFQLWQSCTETTGRIPLHINLPTIDNPEHDMIAKQLRKHEFTEPQIREMKQHRKFILICDGYDESQQTHNLYMSNNLNQPEEWDVQMVVNCRSEYLGSDYRGRFQPGDRNTQIDSGLFQEAFIAPLSLDQVQTCIQQYVLTQQPLWRAEDYQQALELVPGLMDLVKNPFMMALSLEVLPRMIEPGQDLSSTRVTRVGLYDQFVEQWLERNKRRLAEKDLGPQAKAAFEKLSAEGFILNGIEYLKKFAAAIYKEQDGHPVVKYTQLVDEGSWKEAFFCQEHEQILLEACPLTRSGNQHQFIHRTILEYGLARAVFDHQETGNATVDSILDNGFHPDTGATANYDPDPNSPLVWRSFVNDHSLLQFLAERVQQAPVFRKQLLAYIEHSKKSKKWRKAAANAISILVRAGFQFIGADLQGIQIPGADISYGAFDCAQLQDADLRNTNLRGISLQQANLSRAQMSGTKFGELPYLSEDDELRSCAYSPDGKLLVVAFDRGGITVYTTSGWEKVWALPRCHRTYIRRAVFSPTGDQIASGAGDSSVRIWNAGTGECEKIFIQPDEINAVAYSPRGDRIVTASDDRTVRVWDVEANRCIQVLTGHGERVEDVEFSPDGTQIASGSFDSTARIWDAETEACIHVLSGHEFLVVSVAYSPCGEQLVSASADSTLRLWDVRTGVCRHVLAGHAGYIQYVAYSPKGDQLASGGEDRTVRIWDPETGTNRHTFIGHGKPITSIAYSPQGDQLSSGSDDMVVRLWDVSTVASHNAGGHLRDVYGVSCSPQGHLIASSSVDKTIRLWDVETGFCRQTLRGHSNTVNSVAFSPNGGIVASGSFDNTVRLWNVELGTCQNVLDGHDDWVWGVAFSPQGNMIASSSKDRTVRLWDPSSGECLATLTGHSNQAMCVAFSPDGNLVASAGLDMQVLLWDVGSSSYRHVLEGHAHWIWGVAFSPDGNRVASASNDATVRQWDVVTGECQLILIGDRLCNYCVAYSPKGDILASVGVDKMVRFWDVESGECRTVVQDFQGVIRGISWRSTSDGDYLVTGEEGGSVLMWKVTKNEDKYCVNLQWSASKGKLILTDASVQGVRGLSQLDKELLKQRGAVGEPEDQLHATKKAIAMASVVAELTQPSLMPDISSGLETSESM